MDSVENMKKLMEAVDGTPEVANLDAQYANTPNEKVLSMDAALATGDDLNRAKQTQFRGRIGDNPMAMTPVKVKQVQESLERKWAEYKKNES